MMNPGQLQSLCQNAARNARKARALALANPNIGTITGARLKTLDFLRMMAKRRNQQGRPDLKGAARKAAEAKRARKFDAAHAARYNHYNKFHGG